MPKSALYGLKTVGGAFFMNPVQILRRIKSLKTYTEENLHDAFELVLQIEDEKEMLKWNKWVRYEARNHPRKTPKLFDLVHKTYIVGGRYSFDDYMIACEWNREPQARFWIPRRRVLEGKHKIATQIQDFIDDPNALYLGFSLPPGCGKTTLIKFLLGYIAGKYPMSANMYISYSDGMIKMVLDAVRSILTDTAEYDHNNIFVGLSEPDISSEYKTISYRRKGDFPTIGLVSLGGSVTGRTRANAFMVSDDLVKDAEMARSPERLEKLWQDYKATLTTRMIGDDVKQIQLGTIWSAHDPISRMKEEHKDDPRYRFIAIPVCDDEGHSNFFFDHPDRYSDEKIQEIKARLDPADFECLYMQNGIEKQGMCFKRDFMRYYNGVLPDGEPDNRCFVCDVAWGGGDSLSMPIAYVYGGDAFIHDVIFDTRDKTKTKPRVVGKILQHQLRMGRFEANNGGDEYCDDVDRMLRNDYNYRANLSHKKAPTTMGKMARIDQYVPEIKNFYFLAPAYRDEDYERFMTELFRFTLTGSNIHDDAADSSAMLAEFVFHRNNRQVTTGPRPF